MDTESNSAGICKLEAKESHPSPLSLLLAFLTVSLVLEGYRSIGKQAALAFAVISHLDLMLLILCFSKLEKLPFISARRKHLKVVVCFLSMILIAMVAYHVASIMPLAIKVFVWSMAVMTMFIVFYVCLLVRREDSVGEAIDSSLDGKLLPLLSKYRRFESSEKLASGLDRVMV